MDQSIVFSASKKNWPGKERTSSLKERGSPGPEDTCDANASERKKRGRDIELVTRRGGEGGIIPVEKEVGLVRGERRGVSLTRRKKKLEEAEGKTSLGKKKLVGFLRNWHARLWKRWFFPLEHGVGWGKMRGNDDRGKGRGLEHRQSQREAENRAGWKKHKTHQGEACDRR